MRLNLSSDETSKRPRTTRRLQAPGDDQSSVESDHGHGADRLDKPRQSQPVGGMRFTSQTGRRHDGTLDQLASSPAHLIQVGGSASHFTRRYPPSEISPDIHSAGSVAVLVNVETTPVQLHATLFPSGDPAGRGIFVLTRLG